MDTRNYASLEASRRLIEAGIVLETEISWQFMKDPDVWELTLTGECLGSSIPAPSMAEVLRELPPEDVLYHYNDKYKHFFWYDWKVGQVFSGTNPTDALIDLLIWVRKEKKNHVEKV